MMIPVPSEKKGCILFGAVAGPSRLREKLEEVERDDYEVWRLKRSLTALMAALMALPSVRLGDWNWLITWPCKYM